MNETSKVILVDEDDVETGIMDKMEAHSRGLLHRAFSVFIVNREGNMLLHERAGGKYHSAGLWTNACCSHPMPGEGIKAAAERRLQEEMGFSCELQQIDSLKYFVKFDNGLIEYEYDHLLLGLYDGPILADPDEVKDFRFVDINGIDRLLKEDCEQFTFWFRLAFPLVKSHLQVSQKRPVNVLHESESIKTAENALNKSTHTH